MKAKTNKKKYALCIAAAAVLAACIVSFIVYSGRQTVIVCYDLRPEQEQSIQTVILKHEKIKAGRLVFKSFDGTQPLDKVLHSFPPPDLVFLNKSLSSDTALEKVSAGSGFDSDILTRHTLTVRKTAVSKENKVLLVPLASDNAELAVSTVLLNAAGIKTINSWYDLLNLAREAKKRKVISPVLFAGKDDNTLLLVTGALTETLGGPPAEQKLIDAVLAAQKTAAEAKRPVDYLSLMSSLSADGEPLAYTVKLLRSWRQEGLLMKNIYTVDFKDTQAIMNTNQAAVVLMTLSAHRTIPRDIISRYTSIFYPSFSDNTNTNRCFTAPVLCAFRTGKDRTAARIIEYMAQEQRIVSAELGLAPVTTNAKTADHQADQARYWLASTGRPFPSLADAAFTVNKDRHAAAQALRSILEENQ